MRTFLLLNVITILLIFSEAKALCQNCTPVDFDKQIEFSLIKPMLKMHLPEKIKYVQSFGIDVLRVKDPDKLPLTIPFVSEASPEVIAPKYLKEFEEGAIGLYLTPTNYSYRVQKPTILLIESVDDWTVIHEFSHFLFDRARQMQDDTRESTHVMNSEDAQEDFFEAREVFKNLGGYRNQEHKERTIQSFINYANVQMLFAKTCELEEMTIEKFLRQIYKAEQPVGFLPEHFERSSRYIKSTSEKGLQGMKLLLEVCSDLKDSLTKEDESLKTKLSAICQEVENLSGQIQKVLIEI